MEEEGGGGDGEGDVEVFLRMNFIFIVAPVSCGGEVVRMCEKTHFVGSLTINRHVVRTFFGGPCSDSATTLPNSFLSSLGLLLAGASFL